MVLIFLAAGGVVGTLARYGLSNWIHAWAGTAFPWGTLAVNVAGSFLLGLIARATEIAPVTPEVRTMLTIGFCGAFTTFSTFSYETLALLQKGDWTRAALYAFGSLALGLIALLAGLQLAGELMR